MDVTSTETAETAPGTTVAVARKNFNDGRATEIAHALGLPPRTRGRQFSNRFAFFGDDERFAVIAGPQETGDIELALAHAVRWAGQRPITLVLPDDFHYATAHRIPWLRPEKRPTLYLRRPDGSIRPAEERTRDDTVNALVARLGGATPEEDLADSIAPLDLRAESELVAELVEALTRDRRLDAGHRRSGRSWHYAGQRVLTIQRTRGRHLGDCRHPLLGSDGPRSDPARSGTTSRGGPSVS